MVGASMVMSRWSKAGLFRRGRRGWQDWHQRPRHTGGWHTRSGGRVGEGLGAEAVIQGKGIEGDAADLVIENAIVRLRAAMTNGPLDAGGMDRGDESNGGELSEVVG